MVGFQSLRRQITMMELAFNEGSDARLLGRPLSENPYLDMHAHKIWREGWFDVDQNWGSDVKGRWRFRPLRAVEGCE